MRLLRRPMLAQSSPSPFGRVYKSTLVPLGAQEICVYIIYQRCGWPVGFQPTYPDYGSGALAIELRPPQSRARARGDPTRTGIPRLNRRVLCQLSYAPSPRTATFVT